MEEKLNQIRHSCAHLLAAAVKQLYPGAQNAIGPSIENGFYQDFDLGKHTISEEDLPKIEAKMQEILQTWGPFETKEVSVEQAKKDFADNPYKLELIEEFGKEGKTITENNPGNFLDLCKGGHSENPKDEIRAIKLLSVAGAYWRGSEKNIMLTRIYGTAFSSQEELDEYLNMLEEAKKRDHRKIGKEQDLFLISQEIGSGMPIFTPKGFKLREQITNYITKIKEDRAYQFVWTPVIAKVDVYKKSGHWDKYDAMYTPMNIDETEYVLKPMNCPHHFQVYLNKSRSYKDLPFRLAENGTVYRYEKSGELGGLLRVRALTIDDTHTFVRYDQIAEEISNVLDLMEEVYKTFGFTDYQARISVRDPKNSEKYIGSNEVWNEAEKALIDAVEKRKMKYYIGEGEAAFYGPKIDVTVKDSLGRDWQLTTCQLDFNQPENFDLNYVDTSGEQKKPAILHIAILGSIERFLGVYIEHVSGIFPTWLAPVQATVIPISDKNLDYGGEVLVALKEAGIRAEIDDRSETMQSKIRDAAAQKIPYMLIVGGREEEQKQVAVRTRGGEDLGAMPLTQFLDKLKAEVESKA